MPLSTRDALRHEKKLLRCELSIGRARPRRYGASCVITVVNRPARLIYFSAGNHDARRIDSPGARCTRSTSDRPYLRDPRVAGEKTPDVLSGVFSPNETRYEAEPTEKRVIHTRVRTARWTAFVSSSTSR